MASHFPPVGKADRPGNDAASTRQPPCDVAVVSINYHPEPTGIAVYSTGMAEYLRGRGHRVTAYTGFPYYPAWKKSESDEGRIFASESLMGVRVRRNYLYVPAQPRALKRIFHELSFTLFASLRYLLGATPGVTIVVAPPLLLATFIGLIARAKGSRVILHVQDLQPDAAIDLGMLKPGALTSMLFRIERLNYALAHRVSTVSEAMRAKIEAKGVPRQKTFLFKNWADDHLCDASRAALDYRSAWQLGARFVVLYAGNLGVKQGLDSLLRAAQRLIGDPHLVFVIVGDGAEREHLMEIASEKQLKNVTFRPPVPKQNLGSLLATADVSVIPQKAAVDDVALPSKLGNLLSSGTPVIVAAQNGSELESIVTDSGGGVVCAPDDDEALAEAIITLKNSTEKRRHMAERGSAYAKAYMSKSSILEGFSHHLDALASEAEAIAPPFSSGPDSTRTQGGQARARAKKAAVNKFTTDSGWPLKTLARRVLFAPFRLVFIRGTTRHLSFLRVAVLKLFGAKLAPHVLVSAGVKVWYPWNLTMHEGSTLGPSVEVYNFAPVEIGAGAAVSQYSYLCTASHDYTDPDMPLTYRPITIGARAWVAAGCFIGPGVTVGESAVVGARSVVNRDVRAGMVVAGNPAREIKTRAKSAA